MSSFGRRLLAGGLLAVSIWPVGLNAKDDPESLRIAPIFQDVSIGSEPSAQYIVTITNATTVDQAFKFSTRDFGSLDDTGGVAFLGESSSDFIRKHGLATWMKLDRMDAVIPAGQKFQIHVTITNDATLTPGGHYGVVLAEAQTAPKGVLDHSRVGVNQTLSALILLVKSGGADPNLKLSAQIPNGGLWRLPQLVTMRFENEGDRHVIPRGVTEVQDPWGHTVEQGVLNEGSGMILPDNTRRYQTPLVQLAKAWLPGAYVLTTRYRYDGTTQMKLAVVTFWYMGSVWLWLIGLLVVGSTVAGGLWWRRWWKHRHRGKRFSR